MAITQFRDSQMKGEVQGPASSTDNAFPVFDGTSGKLLKETGITVDASDHIYGVGDINSDGTIKVDSLSEYTAGSGVTIEGVVMDGNTVSSSLVTSDSFFNTSSTLSIDNSGNISTTGTINLNPASGGTIKSNTVDEYSVGSGVTIDSVLLKDGNVDGRDVSADGTKLDGIESGATADQTDAEIETAINNQLTGTVVGTSDTQTLTNKTIDGGTNTLQDIPSSALKEAFFKGRKQENTTNSDVAGYKVMHGWGYMNGGSSRKVTESVTFPTAFSSAPVVIVGFLGLSTSTPTAIGDFNQTGGSYEQTATGHSITSTSFTAEITTENGNNLGTNDWGYSWIAIGPA